MVKRLIPLVSLSIVLFVAGAALAKPDLVVTDIALTRRVRSPARSLR